MLLEVGLCLFPHLCFLHVKAQSEGDLRLVSKGCRRNLQGRLEIYHSGIWGTVCSDFFSYPDAVVVCRQLGFSYLSEAEYYTAGDGTGSIFLDDVSCNGHETSLSSCGHGGWGIHNCLHSLDVGVRCFDEKEGFLRLVGGSDLSTGRLEIFHNGAWGTICDDNFSNTDAQVACKQMKKGYTSAQIYYAGSGTGTIWMDDVSCNGFESRLDLCIHNGWSLHNCGHNEDVGIRCYGSYNTIEGDLRLVGSDCYNEGRLEVFHNGAWGTICDDAFSTIDAWVACRQLGYSSGSAVSYTHGGGSGTIWLDNVNCIGTEKRIDNCSNPSWGVHNCVHSEDVGVRCYGQDEVNGNWGGWSSWGVCSVSCGTGIQQRNRQCNNPIPSSGGYDCIGTRTATQNCNAGNCPSITRDK